MTPSSESSSEPGLPVELVLPELHDALKRQRVVILQAPPGTGKTTRVPPSLVGQPWLGQRRVLVLEPRRVAARAAAARMALERNEEVGHSIGLRTRFDTRVSDATRVEVVTEGVLTRMLLSDPGLEGIGVIVFDEFHERSIHADTAMAFARETADALRDDLRMVVMSATLDADSLATRLRTDSIIRADAAVHPVVTTYHPPAPGRTVDEEVPDAVMEVLGRDGPAGDILVFLAGAGAINRAERELRRRLGDRGELAVTPLHGSLPPAEQDRALQPDPAGRRKVILSTPIAETSVTIDGVRIVIDTGRRRRPEINHGRGMSQLRTVGASKAATDQRRGRAGRQAPGVCIRLWSESEQANRPMEEPPEILTSDLTSLALQVAAWGATEPSELPWLDPPPTVAYSAAVATLTSLGAFDEKGRLTDHGRAMNQLGAEPRLAHLMLRGADSEAQGLAGATATACALAASLADRDLLSGRERPVDLRTRVELVARERPGERGDRGVVRQARAMARRWESALPNPQKAPVDLDLVGLLTSFAFPDRIARRRDEPGNFLLASGAGVTVPIADELSRHSWLAVAETEGSGADARVLTAAPLSTDDIESHHAQRIDTSVHGGWDRRKRDVVFENRETLGSIVVSRSPVAEPSREAVVEGLLAGVRREGLGLLTWDRPDHRFRERLAFAHTLDPDEWPSVDDNSLLDRLEEWLAPSLASVQRRADLEKIKPRDALTNLLDWRRGRDLDRLAPTHVDVPSGSRIPIDYAPEGGPVLAVRLQEIFGLTDSPTVGDGAAPVVMHLLSPAHRPVQVTTDLASFWESGYREVRRELRGRYPKHHWPDDPTSAPPTAKAKRRK